MFRYSCTALFNIKIINLSFKALGVFTVDLSVQHIVISFVFQQDVPNFKFNQSATSAFRKFDIIKSGEHQSWKCSGFNNHAVIFFGEIEKFLYWLKHLAIHKMISPLPPLLREDINWKKTFSFGHCPNDGGGGLPMPEFFGPLFRSAFLVNKKSLFLQKCQCIEILTVF